MERQVVLTAKDKNYNRKKVNNEILTINKMLLYIESFQAFCNTNEVFDGNTANVIRNHKKLHDLYWGDLNTNVFVCVVNKN